MNTKQKIEVMQAYLDGKPIKVTTCGKVFVYTLALDGDLVWNFAETDYEIVKEPKPGYRLYAAYAEAADVIPMQEDAFDLQHSAKNWAEVERRIKSGELKFD